MRRKAKREGSVGGVWRRVAEIDGFWRKKATAESLRSRENAEILLVFQKKNRWRAQRHTANRRRARGRSADYADCADSGAGTAGRSYTGRRGSSRARRARVGGAAAQAGYEHDVDVPVRWQWQRVSSACGECRKQVPVPLATAVIHHMAGLPDSEGKELNNE